MEALDPSVLGVSCGSRRPVQQDDSGGGGVLMGDVRGDPARHVTDALQGVLFSG